MAFSLSELTKGLTTASKVIAGKPEETEQFASKVSTAISQTQQKAKQQKQAVEQTYEQAKQAVTTIAKPYTELVTGAVKKVAEQKPKQQAMPLPETLKLPKDFNTLPETQKQEMLNAVDRYRKEQNVLARGDVLSGVSPEMRESIKRETAELEKYNLLGIERSQFKRVTPYNLPEYIMSESGVARRLSSKLELRSKQALDVAKVAGRVAIGLPTYGISEAALSYLPEEYDVLGVKKLEELEKLPKLKIPLTEMEIGLHNIALGLSYMKGAGKVEKFVYDYGAPLLAKITNPALKMLGRISIFAGSQLAYDVPMGYIQKPMEGMTRAETAAFQGIAGLGAASLFKGIFGGIELTTKGAEEFAKGRNIGTQLMEKMKDYPLQKQQSEIFQMIRNSPLNLAQKLGVFSKLEYGRTAQVSKLLPQTEYFSSLGEMAQGGKITAKKPFDVGVTPKQMVETKLPIAQPVTKDLESLMQEARKYKSAEDFVKQETKKQLLGEKTLVNIYGDKYFLLRNKAKNNIRTTEPVGTLGELFKTDKLKKIIGDAKDIPVYVVKDADFNGRFITDGFPRVEVSGNSLYKFDQTLLEEATHANQYLKGRIFKRGVSSDYANDINEKLAKNASQNIQTILTQEKLKTKSQLTDIWNKAQQKQFVTEPKAMPELQAGKRPLQTGDISRQVEEMKSLNTQIKKIEFKPESAFRRGVEKLLTPISTRLENIAPELKPAIRRLDFDIGTNVVKNTKATLPFLQKIKKFSKEDSKVFDLARKNSDSTVINSLAKKYGIEKELQQTRDVLDDIYQRGNEVGMEIEYRGDYFPRVIKDPEGLMNYLHGTDGWSMIEKAIKNKAEKLGVRIEDLSLEEKASIVNSLLRGYGGDKITLSIPGHAKEREIDFVTKDLDKFYAKADTALVSYISKMNEEIAARKFFGKELSVNPDQLSAESSIGAYVMKLVSDNRIKPSQEKAVSDILKARFHKGRMNEALQTFRNVEYLSTMGNPISAITQIGDFGFSLYENGFFKTAKALFKKGITREDLGIERIAQEFTEPSRTAKLVDKVFKVVGLDFMDRLGKETLVNASWDNITQKALKGDVQLNKELNLMFGKQSKQILEDLKNKKLTDDTKFILFNKLADFQPISKSEMPEKYLSMPNGRIFYMLKSYTLKQLDVFRREVGREITKGNVIKGIGKMTALGGLLMLANATADEIKDFVLGRKTSLTDRVIDNFVRLFGLSKFDIYKIREEGLGMGIAKKILFPTSIVDDISKDLENIVTKKKYKTGVLKGKRFKLETTQRIPLVGKMYYWWYGRGAQKQKVKRSKEK